MPLFVWSFLVFYSVCELLVHEIDIDAAIVSLVFWGRFVIVHGSKVALVGNNGF